MQQDRINYARLEQEYDHAGESPERFHLRVRLPRTPADDARGVQLILTTAAAGIVLVSIVHLSTFLLPESLPSIVYPLCLTVPFGLVVLFHGYSVRTAALGALIPPAAWLVGGVLRWMGGVPLSLYAVYIAGLLIALAVAGRVAEHYGAWLAPRAATRRRSDHGFFFGWLSRTATFFSWLRRSPQTLRAVAVFAVPLITSHVVALLTGRSLLAATTIGTLVTLAILAAVLVLRLMARTIDRAYLRTPLHALLNYLTYGQCLPGSVQHAPGVFRSPAGGPGQRILMMGGAFYAIYVAVLPLTSYLPVYAPFIPQHIWKAALDSATDRRLLTPDNPQQVQIAFPGPGREITFEGPRYTPPEEPKRLEDADLRGLDSRGRREQIEKRNAEMAAYPQVERAAREAWQKTSDAWEQRQPTRFMNEVPLGWLFLSLHSFWSAPQHFVVLYTLSFVFCLGYPAFILYVFLLGATRDALAAIADVDRAIPESAPDDQRWTTYTRTLALSPHRLERHALWVGTHAFLKHPVLLDRRILAEHGYIVGDSGSGKTALGVTSLITQLIERSAADVARATEAALRALTDPTGAEHEQAAAAAAATTGNPIVIIDLKGDPALFERTKQSAEQTGVTFKHFTNEVGKTSYAFNPLEQVNTDQVTANQVAETILEALNLSHGEGYGRSYFSRVARHWLTRALKSYRGDTPLENFDQLLALVGPSDMSDREKQDAFELIAVLESLASIEHLNVGPITSAFDPQVYQNAIHMPQVIAENQVVYFWLPALVETTTVREIAKLAVYALVQAARQQSHSGKQVYLFIDEFQRIASTGFKIILEQARSMGVGLILANQSVADLQTADADLRPTVHNNTRCKIVFSAQDLDQQEHMMKASGESWALRAFNLAFDRRGEQASSAESYQMHPRLLRNDIIETSDDPKRCIVQVARGLGLSQYSGYSIAVDTLYTCSPAQYHELSTTPWPAQTRATAFVWPRSRKHPEAAVHEQNISDPDRTLQPEHLHSITERLEFTHALDADPKVRTFRDRLRALGSIYSTGTHVH